MDRGSLIVQIMEFSSLLHSKVWEFFPSLDLQSHVNNHWNLSLLVSRWLCIRNTLFSVVMKSVRHVNYNDFTTCHVAQSGMWHPLYFPSTIDCNIAKCGLMTVSVGRTSQKFNVVRTLHALPWFIDQLFFILYLCRGDSLKLYHVTQKGGWPICLTMLSMAKCVT